MTAGQNVAFPLRMRGVPRGDVAERVRRALELVHLPVHSDRRINQLSGGQQQRVALARALVFEPDLVLMDEPLGALDRQLRERMQYEIKSIHERLGTTVVYVTHDQSEALTMSDRVAVFSGGSILQLDTPKSLYDNPQCGFVAGFIGENNRLEGDVLERGHDRCSVRVAGQHVIDAANHLKSSDKAVICIRPERISLIASSDERPGRACLPMTISAVTYLGDQLRIQGRLTAGQILTVKQPSSAGAQSLAVGKNMFATWMTSDALAFDREPMS
jgi:putative spermidine/putrescine transport system ATP-binding protein